MMILNVFLAILLNYSGTLHIIGASDFPKPGHLEPFGGHRPPDVIIDELYDIPDPQTFWNEYVADSKAVIFRGAATRSPGFLQWTEENLKDKYGDLEVRLEGKHERNSPVPVGEKGLGRDTLRSFVETFREKDTYIVSQLPEPMYKDFYIPPCISCGNMRRRIVEIDLWMSSGNTHSIIHKDAFNAINCLMKGTKYWKLIEFKYEKWLYKTWEPKREVGGNSRVNAHSVDLLKFPDIAKVRWSNITINAGDCLFLPKSYYHQVSSYGDPNMAVSVLFSRIARYDDAGCNETLIDFTPLSDVDVLWSWPGHGIMSMGNLDAWMMRANYAEFARKNGRMTAEKLLHELASIFPEKGVDELRPSAEKAWKILDKTGKGSLTAEELEALENQVLRRHTMALDLLEPSNTEEFEYAYIDEDELEELLNELMERHPEGVKRRRFVDMYVAELGGTEALGNEIFDGFVGRTVDVATKEEITTNMDSALKKWRESGETPSTPEIDARYAGDTDLFKDEL